MGVEILIATGVLPAYPPQPNSEYRVWYLGSQTVGDKVHCQKGNSPDRQLRSQSKSKCCKGSEIAKTARMLA
jgi:hypothetical protein